MSDRNARQSRIAACVAARLFQAGTVPVSRWVDEYVTDDYPYGRLRTEARWYVETTRAGQRVCRVTVNPKNGRPSKPKCTTYYTACKIGQGSDGYTYLLCGMNTYTQQIYIIGGNMRQQDVFFPKDSGYDAYARILGFV